MRICFTTICTNESYKKNARVDFLINSAKHFHPKIPFVIYNEEMLKELAITERWLNLSDKHSLYFAKALIGQKLSDHYDLVIYIDGDSTITGSLSDIFEGDYDLGVVRNNSDIGTAGKDKGITIIDPFKQEEIPVMKYVNAGLVAVKNKKVWSDWLSANKKYGSQFPAVDQDILNCIVNSDKYKVRYLDPVGSPVSYGVSNVWGKSTHWDSWKNAFIKDNELYISNGFNVPILAKVLHVAGGSTTGYPKQDFDRHFTNEAKEWLKKITAEKTDCTFKDVHVIKGYEMRPDNDKGISNKGISDIIELLPDNVSMVEIGCYFGESTLAWENSDKIKQIYAVDKWEDHYDKNDLSSERGNMKEVEAIFDKNICNKPKIIKIKAASVDACTKFKPNSIDFIYIDGSHTYEDVSADIKAWTPILKNKSILAGHDYNNVNVCKAVNDNLGIPNYIFSDNSWAVVYNKKT